MKKIIYIIAIPLILAGCASGQVVPIGNEYREPLKENEPVYIYYHEDEIKFKYSVIGILSYVDPGKYQILSLASVIPAMKSKARRAGANGLIIDETHVVKSGIISTGIGVTARAIVVSK